MIITLTQTMRNNVFKMVVTTEVDTLDSKYIDQYGEPQVDKLGTISYTDSGDDPATFELAGGPSYAKVRSSMPIEFSLDANVDSEAQEKTLGWGTTMRTRITAAMTALKMPTLPTSPNTSQSFA
jgi:hypothetical protein